MFRTGFSLLAGILLFACNGSTGGTNCPDGQELVDGDCVDVESRTPGPEGCGTGTWGDLDTGSARVFVDGSRGNDQGNGDLEDPVVSIRLGLIRARALGGGRILVAEGVYEEEVALSDSDDGIEIIGRCPQLVRVESASSSRPTIQLTVLDEAQVTIEGLTIGRGTPSVDVAGGSMVLRNVAMENAFEAAVSAAGVNTSLTMESVSIADATPEPGSNLFGYGVNVSGGATAVLTDLTVTHVTDAAVRVRGNGTTATITRLTAEDTQAPEGDDTGQGLAVAGGASVTGSEITILRSVGRALDVRGQGSNADLDGVNIEDTAVDPQGDSGLGIIVSDRASLTISNATVRNTVGVGAFVGGSGASLTGSFLTVRDTGATPDDSGGTGISVEAGASFACSNCNSVGNRDRGLRVLNNGSSADITGGTFNGTQTIGSTTSGVGIWVGGGTVVTVGQAQIRDNDGPGLVLDGGSLTLTSTTVQDNFWANIYMRGGTLDMTGGVLTGASPSTDGTVGGAVGLLSVGGGEPTSVTIDGTLIRQNIMVGAYLLGPGSYDIRDATFSGSSSVNYAGTRYHGNGVAALGGISAWDGAQGLRIEGCTFSNNAEAGVVLDDSTGLFVSNTWSPATPNIVQQNCGNNPAPPNTTADSSAVRSICIPADAVPVYAY